LKLLERVWKVRVKGFAPCQGSFRVKVWCFWTGFGMLGLKAYPLAVEVLRLKFEASR
jgi:hypothetical protein